MSATPDGRVASVKQAESEADRVRVRNEASVLAELRHPNVVELLEADADLGSIQTAFCARTTLAATPPASMDELADVAESLVTVLRELHQLGWAHGGLSPDHCLVANSNRIVLCSLGRARRISGPSHPAARGDRDGLRAMLAGWRAALAPPRQRSERDAAARLDRAVASTGASLPLFRRPPPTDATPPPVAASTMRGHNEVDSIRPALVRAVVYGAMVVGLLIDTPAATGGGAQSLLATTARWTLLIARPLAFYGLAVSIVCAVAIRTRRERWMRVGRRLAPAPLRRIITGVALAGAVSTIASHLTTPSPSRGIVVAAPRATPLPIPPTSTTTSTTSTSTTVPPAIEPRIVDPPPPVIATPPRAEPLRWTIGPGDHLWHVAAESLARAWGRRPTDLETDLYWRSLIAVNRAHLPDPRNPDLVFVGQVLELPPIPPAPTAEAA